MPIPANRARFLFAVAGLHTQFRVLGFQGREAISDLFQFSIEVVCTDDLDLNCLLNKDAVLELAGNPGRLLHGTIASARHTAMTFRFRHYQLTLVPRIYWLGLRHNFRIFQDLSVPEIAAMILRDAGLEPDFYRFELTRNYRPRSFTVQYDESELHFLERLLAAEGIHFHFEHHPDRHVLIVADHQQSFGALKPRQLDYRADAAMVASSCIQRFTKQEAVTVDGVMLNDYDFQKPQHSLLAQTQDQAFSRLSVYRWPGKYDDVETGSRLSRQQLDALRVEHQQATGGSNCETLTAGNLFGLARHPVQNFNQDYLLTVVEHRGEQPQVLEEYSGPAGSHYSNQFTAISSGQTYRPLSFRPKPLAAAQTAVVVGPPGEQIYTDEHGRIKVRFHWDREGKHSCWLRLAQGWAGNFWGSMILPRVGQEVLVEFVDGDPDRPIVTGCLYHGLHKPAYALPEHKSRTLIRSQSLSGAGGHELMLEDGAEQERISIHSSRDLDIHVAQDMRVAVEGHHQSYVVGDQVVTTAGTSHLTVASESRTRITGSDSLNVDKSLHLKTAQELHQQAGQELHGKAGIKLVIEAATAIHLKAGAGSILLDATGVHLNGPAIGLNSGAGSGAAGGASPAQPKGFGGFAYAGSGGESARGIAGQAPEIAELRFKGLDSLPEPLALVRREILALAGDEKVLGTFCQRQADGTCLRTGCVCNPARV